MPEGCLDRSTGWLPSNAGSAIHGPNPPHHQRKSPISLRQRDEKKAQSEADSRGKGEAVRDPAERISKPAVFYRDRGEGGWRDPGGWLDVWVRVCLSVEEEVSGGEG